MFKKLIFVGSSVLFIQIALATPSLEEKCMSDMPLVANSKKTIAEYSVDNIKVSVFTNKSSKSCWEMGKKEKNIQISYLPRNSGGLIRPWEMYYHIMNKNVLTVYFTYTEDKRPQMLATTTSATKAISVYCEGDTPSLIESLILSEACRKAIKKHSPTSDKFIEGEFTPNFR